MSPSDNLTSVDIVPVKCPRCGEAQNTSDGTTDPLALDAQVGCMVCGYRFDAGEYRRLLGERLERMVGLKLGEF